VKYGNKSTKFKLVKKVQTEQWKHFKDFGNEGTIHIEFSKRQIFCSSSSVKMNLIGRAAKYRNEP